jgi:hypothetical protein
LVCIPAFTAAPIPNPAINSVGLKNCPKKPLPKKLTSLINPSFLNWDTVELSSSFFLSDATYGLIESLVTEPLFYKMAQNRQDNYDIDDGLLNIMFGSLAGGVLGGIGVIV